MASSQSSQEEEQGEAVVLYVYDLSRGMAAALSPSLLGQRIDGIWHTGLVVFGHEYYYGGGVQYALPAQTMAGVPQYRLLLGRTARTQAQFHAFLRSIEHRFRPESYSLLKHNCNNFSDEAASFLLPRDDGRGIPKWITGLPEEALSTPLGAMLRPMVEGMEASMRAQGGAGGPVPWAEGGAAGRVALPQRSLPTPPPDAPSASPVVAAHHAEFLAQPQPRRAAATAAAAPAPGPDATPPLGDPAHPHAGLAYRALRRGARPMLAASGKHASFATLVRATNPRVEESLRLTDGEKETVRDLGGVLTRGAAGEALPHGSFDALSRLLRWPAAKLFPALALVRAVAARPEGLDWYAREHLAAPERSVVSRLLELASPDGGAPAPARMMALCAVSNLTRAGGSGVGERLAEDERALALVHAALDAPEPSLRRIGASLAYNMALVLPKECSDAVLGAASALAEELRAEADAEAATTIVLALAHLAHGNSDACAVLSSLDAAEALAAARGRFAGAAAFDEAAHDLELLLNTVG